MADQRISQLPSGFSGIRTSDALPIERGIYPSSANFKITLGNIFDLAGGAVNNGEPPGTTPYSFPSLSVLANGAGSTGYVGIGTNAPTAALDVTDVTGIQIRSTGTAQLRIAGSSGAIGTSSLDITHNSTAASILNRASTKLSLTSNGSLGFGTSSTERMTISTTGQTISMLSPGGSNPFLLTVGESAGTGECHIEVGYGRTANGYAYIDLIGDTTYTDYGARFIRGSTGANAFTSILHTGTGDFSISAEQAAPIKLTTNGATRLTVGSTGGVTLDATPATSGNDTTVATTAFVKSNVPGGSSGYTGGLSWNTTYQNTTGRAQYVSYNAFAQNPGTWHMELYIWPAGASYTSYRIARMQDNAPNNSYATVAGMVPTGWFWRVEGTNNSDQYFWQL